MCNKTILWVKGVIIKGKRWKIFLTPLALDILGSSSSAQRNEVDENRSLISPYNTISLYFSIPN